jgi:hypothetical protein
VARTLDTMRASILRSVKEVETQLEVVEPSTDAPGALSA